MQHSDFYKSTVLGQRSGLFVLFFTEMWERFSFYGMRVLLIPFLTAVVLEHDPEKSGWGWDAQQAGALYGTYAMMLYLTPIFGGIIADKYIGSRMAIIIGAVIMTLGHAAMAVDSEIMFMLGLAGLVIGTGFFKPNMPSILGQMYKDLPEKKDGAYTIFYMGVNSGAFFGMLLCGYIGEEVGWHYGFGLAGIFMLLGTLQFVFAKPLMGNLGVLTKKNNEITDKELLEKEETKANPFTTKDIALTIIVSVIGLAFAFNDPLSKNGVLDMFQFMDTQFLRGQYIAVIIALVLFVYLLVSRILRYEPIVRDRMFAVGLLAFFLLFFFMSFEQGASSLVLVARDYTERTLDGTASLVFKVINTALTVVPLAIISYVLVKLAQKTWDKIALSNIVLIVCFLLIWAVSLWMLNIEFQKEASEIKFTWFSILNSFFVISLASVVSKIWNSKYNPPAAFKYGFGLLLVSLGFFVMYLGYEFSGGNETAKMAMIFLVITYLFHTLGELFMSPVGLSYVSKLVPARMLTFMFGIWYLALAIANKIAAALGGQVEVIKEEHGLGMFFLIFTFIPAAAGVLVMLVSPLIKKLMHGIK